jgi:hypothetical protein
MSFNNIGDNMCNFFKLFLFKYVAMAMPTSAVFIPTTHMNHRSYVSVVVETKLETLRARSTGELLRIDAL